MTRRDYEALAEAISKLPNHTTRARLLAAARVAYVCTRFHSNFDSARFLAACGLTEDDLATFNMARGNLGRLS